MAGASSAASMLVFLGVLSACVGPAAADTFLGSHEGGDLAFETTLLADLEGALGSTHRAAAEQRLGQLEILINPLFDAMPKDARGRLGHATVRYVLHRLFLEKHGWFVKGLEPAGEAFNTSSPTHILKHRVPHHVQAIFENRLGAHGFGVHEIAVLAATLENLVHEEAVDRLRGAYGGAGLAINDTADEADMEKAIDTYMAIYIMGKNHSLMSPAEIKHLMSKIHLAYPTWPDTQKFVREVRQDVLGNNDASTMFSFDAATRVIEEIGHRYGRWQDSECKDIKKSLVKIEDTDTGRVSLKDSYSAALAGHWQFSESAAYMRQLGALDDSSPEHPAIIISNYVNSPSNCISASRFYAVCCLDDCEPLLAHIERDLAAPDATPERISELVMALPSATVEAPRIIPSLMRARLDEIAKHHGGRVPLHGRLFAQWMHHAYPRECPYPHVTGTTRPMTADEWMTETGSDRKADEEEMLEHVKKPARKTKAYELPWTNEEELFVVRPTLPKIESQAQSWAHSRVLVLVIALVALALSIGKVLTTSREAMAPEQKIYI